MSVKRDFVSLLNYVQSDHTSYLFSLVYGIEATFPIKFEVESLRVAVGIRLNDNESLRNKLGDLEELDEKRQRAALHIETIQRRRKIIFHKRHKKKALQRGMLVMLQDEKKKDFSGKFEAVWLGPYIVKNIFPNNSVQLETLNGPSIPTRTTRSKCKI